MLSSTRNALTQCLDCAVLLVVLVAGAKDHRTGDGGALEGGDQGGAGAAAGRAAPAGSPPGIPAGWVQVKGSKNAGDEATKLLSREGLEGLMGEVKKGAHDIVHEANVKVAAKLQASQALLKSAIEKFEAAATIVLRENTQRAGKIQEQMEALQVATSHGKFNGKASATPLGKCCCGPLEAEADVSKADCAWHNALVNPEDGNETQSVLEGRLDTFQCPRKSNQALEYTDLVRPSITGSPDFVDAHRIDRLLLACVRSPGWQARSRGVVQMEPEATLDQADQVRDKQIYPDLPSLRETLATKMRTVESRVQAILHGAAVPLSGDEAAEDGPSLDADAPMQERGTPLASLPNSAQAAMLNSTQFELAPSPVPVNTFADGKQTPSHGAGRNETGNISELLTSKSGELSAHGSLDQVDEDTGDRFKIDHAGEIDGRDELQSMLSSTAGRVPDLDGSVGSPSGTLDVAPSPSFGLDAVQTGAFTAVPSTHDDEDSPRATLDVAPSPSFGLDSVQTHVLTAVPSTHDDEVDRILDPFLGAAGSAKAMETELESASRAPAPARPSSQVEVASGAAPRPNRGEVQAAAMLSSGAAVLGPGRRGPRA